MKSDKKYQMSFTVGGLFYQESITATDLYIRKNDWSVVRDAILESNLFQIRTGSSLKRIYREVISRLKLLSVEQLELLKMGARQEKLQILWIKKDPSTGCSHLPKAVSTLLSICIATDPIQSRLCSMIT